MVESRRATRGFTLLELIVTVSILVTLAGMALPMVGSRVQRARDVRRLQDVQTLVRALDEYLLDTASLPDHDAEAGQGGWDTTLDGSFVSLLVDEGYLREPLRDPINDASFHYRYQHYRTGYQGFASDFYVVGILNFETEEFRAQTGSWAGTSRDWTDEMAYVVGGLSR